MASCADPYSLIQFRVCVAAPSVYFHSKSYFNSNTLCHCSYNAWHQIKIQAGLQARWQILRFTENVLFAHGQVDKQVVKGGVPLKGGLLKWI